MGTGIELSVADVARIHGISRITAWRWMRRLHEQHGPSVVCKRGRVYVTTQEAFEKVTAHKRPNDDALVRRIRILEERQLVSERRLDGVAGDVRELRSEVAKSNKTTFAHLFAKK